MKARKFFALIAALLCISMLFVACSKKEEETEAPTEPPVVEEPEEVVYGLADIMNLSYAPKSTTVNKATELTIVGDPEDHLGKLVVTYEEVNDSNDANDPWYGDTSNDIYRVYDLDTAEVVWTGTQSKVEGKNGDPDTYTKYSVELINDDYFAVLTTVYSGYNFNDIYINYFDGYIMIPANGAEKTSATNTVTIYDVATKTAVRTIGANTVKYHAEAHGFDTYYENAIEAYYSRERFDLVIKDNSVYREDSEGKLTLVKTYDLESIPVFMAKHGDYYYGAYNIYGIGDDESAVAIFDKALNRVASYEFPSYIYDVECSEFLNNGDMLIQYSIALGEDADDYDYVIDNMPYGDPLLKFDLVTVIVKASDGSVTELDDVDYLISKVTTTFEEDDENKKYNTEKVENIAKILYIDDNKRLDYSDKNYSLVAMANDGSIVAPIELGKDIKNIPYPLGGGFFSVNNVYDESCILNNKGEIVTKVSAANGNAKYFYTEKAIYDLSGNVVYDLKANDATAVTCGASFIITSHKDDVTTVYLFADGKTTQIGILDGANATIDSYAVFSGFYSTYNKKTEKYTYYNAAGEQLITSEDTIIRYYGCEDYIIFRAYDSGNDKYTFYKFSMAK